MEEVMRKQYGRPKKGDDRRGHKVTVAYSKDEIDMVNHLARLMGVRTAEYIRKTSLCYRMREVLTYEDRVLLRRLYELSELVSMIDREQATKGFMEILTYFRKEVRYGRKDREE